MAGSTRQPRALKALKGTLRPHRENPQAPNPPSEPVPPPPLHLDALGRETWERLAREVESLGVFHRSSESAFRLLVRLACAVENPPADEPATAAARNAQAFSAALRDWGLTPAARGRVTVAPATPADELAEFREALRRVP